MTFGPRKTGVTFRFFSYNSLLLKISLTGPIKFVVLFKLILVHIDGENFFFLRRTYQLRNPLNTFANITNLMTATVLYSTYMV